MPIHESIPVQNFPIGPYQIIYADPPWTYRDQASAGQRGAVYHYPLLTDEDIGNLPVQDISDKDSILFLWATAPKMQEALTVMKQWGFEYKTIGFVWVKRNKIAPSWFWGMGRWTRSNAEYVLLGTRGRPSRVDAGVHQIIDKPFAGHSIKPPIVRDKIIQLVGNLPKVELFARQSAEGWDKWGSE